MKTQAIQDLPLGKMRLLWPSGYGVALMWQHRCTDSACLAEVEGSTPSRSMSFFLFLFILCLGCVYLPALKVEGGF
ncbi:hypothetical protein BDV41DRAFT_519992 [Aspergillus transmontanensis]|uniref:Uncharacterized protein n=1 Tax=Aspergillus transmontanensis TaxID=1034304 RepID=A0A5N6WFX4_9EURO|nr:hypothetical protein BDV41DRAFT_519992 [Aspergillus transmontanensis]